MGGALTATSAYGQCSTFTMRLPAAVDDRPSQPCDSAYGCLRRMRG